MSKRFKELEAIIEEVKRTDNISQPTRKQFWKLVRQIKQEMNPDSEEVAKATEIRNFLFANRARRVYSLGWFLAVETVFGILFLMSYISALSVPVSWFNMLSWSVLELLVVLVRFFSIFAMIALFYPYGRLMAGAVFGIKFDGMYFSEQKEPGLKIEYESFLKAKPTNRKWFFFFSGLWTYIVAFGCGVIGWLLAGDIIGFTLSTIFLSFYAFVLVSGTPKNSRGEMGHYNRERLIESAWKRKNAETDLRDL
jgi:hypothetical protein